MKVNIRKKLSSNKGITLIALVITIIVLLILAGVSLSMVFDQDGIFNRAEQAVDKHGQAKARETLELTLGEAQMQKYEEGLTDEQLDNKIGAIEGELLPKEKPEYPNLQNVIVDGYIFEIDRSVPKIVDYIGPADGVIITAVVTQNGNWQNPVATLSGTIKTYSGGNITNSTATIVSGNANITGFPTTGGDYTIGNIAEDTDIKITAQDSTGKKAEKTINIVPKRDTTGPIIKTFEAKAERLKITISATAEDTESGMQKLTYNITSTQDTTLDGIPADKRTGILEQGKSITIETTPTGDREETKYTISVIAIDNAGNTSSSETKEVITIDGITLSEAKKLVNKDTLQKYIGTRVIDYNPPAGGIYRVFYYDAEDDGKGNGYFGPKNTLYLKRDFVANDTSLSKYINHLPSDDGILMKRMNPLWAKSTAHNSIDLYNEHAAAGLCDPEEWKEYKTSDSSYAIGSPSLEMYVKAYNVYKQNNPNGTALVCKLDGDSQKFGYLVGINGIYVDDGICTPEGSIEKGHGSVFLTEGSFYWRLASPSGAGTSSGVGCGLGLCLPLTGGFNNTLGGADGLHFERGICPIVPIDQ